VAPAVDAAHTTAAASISAEPNLVTDFKLTIAGRHLLNSTTGLSFATIR
jgi:hypothetical protein